MKGVVLPGEMACGHRKRKITHISRKNSRKISSLFFFILPLKKEGERTRTEWQDEQPTIETFYRFERCAHLIFLFSQSQTKNCVPKSVLANGRSQTSIASSLSQPKTERVSNERPFSPGVQGPRPLVLFPPLSPEKAGTPHGQWPPRSGKLRISCLYDRHYLTLLVTAILSDQRGRSTLFPPLHSGPRLHSGLPRISCATGA